MPPTPRRDPYTVLGLSPPCSAADIRKAYLKAALRCHPDRHPNDAEATQKFQAVSQAYQTLSGDGQGVAADGVWTTPDDDAPIDLAQYKAMFEQLARKAKTFWEDHQAEIAVAKTLWSSFKARLAGVGSDTGSDSGSEGEPADTAPPDAFTHDGLGGSDSEASSTDSDADADSVGADSPPKAPPLLLTIVTTPAARAAQDIHKVEYTRYRWDAREGRAAAEQYAVLVPVEHDEATFPGEGDWLDPVGTVAGDVVVFVEVGEAA
jgi:molecular chaperone DnaJ